MTPLPKTKSSARVLVAGAGAIGSVFGGMLRAAGHPVALLGRAPHINAIVDSGLRIDGIWGEHYAEEFEVALQVADLNGPFDLALLCVKSFDTTATVELIARVMSPDGIVLSLQNGLGNIEIVASRFAPERSFGASVLVGAELPEPGRATVTVQAAPVVIGPLAATEASMTDARRLVDMFEQAGVSFAASEQILSVLWAKVFYNAPLNALGALLAQHYGALGADGDLRAIMDKVIDEAFNVAQAEGMPLQWASAQEYRDLFYSQLVPSTYVHRSSMLHDLERGRRTEIEAINGEVWRRGAVLGIDTPANEMLTRLIRWRSQAANSLR